MARKLKIFQTSQGFFDLAIAAPSMKAALEAWGTSADLFHKGFAWESNDRKVIAGATAKPGVVLKRPVGSNEPFRENAHLPTSLPAAGSSAVLGHAKHPKAPKKVGKAKIAKSKKKSQAEEKAERKAALAYEKEEKRRHVQQQKEQAKAARRRAKRAKAEAIADATFTKARTEHEAIAEKIGKERDAIETRAQAEQARWEKLEDRLQRAMRKARSL